MSRGTGLWGKDGARAAAAATRPLPFPKEGRQAPRGCSEPWAQGSWLGLGVKAGIRAKPIHTPRPSQEAEERVGRPCTQTPGPARHHRLQPTRAQEGSLTLLGQAPHPAHAASGTPQVAESGQGGHSSQQGREMGRGSRPVL